MRRDRRVSLCKVGPLASAETLAMLFTTSLLAFDGVDRGTQTMNDAKIMEDKENMNAIDTVDTVDGTHEHQRSP